MEGHAPEKKRGMQDQTDEAEPDPLYDDAMDDADEKWVQSHIRTYLFKYPSPVLRCRLNGWRLLDGVQEAQGRRGPTPVFVVHAALSRSVWTAKGTKRSYLFLFR